MFIAIVYSNSIKSFCFSKMSTISFLFPVLIIWVFLSWIVYPKNFSIMLITMKIICFAFFSAAAAAKSLQSCPTLCDPIDGSLPGSLVPGILQARTLEWVAISFSSSWKWKVKVKLLSPVRLLATPSFYYLFPLINSYFCLLWS